MSQFSRNRQWFFNDAVLTPCLKGDEKPVARVDHCINFNNIRMYIHNTDICLYSSTILALLSEFLRKLKDAIQSTAVSVLALSTVPTTWHSVATWSKWELCHFCSSFTRWRTERVQSRAFQRTGDSVIRLSIVAPRVQEWRTLLA